jgi:hypothetical protein
MQHDWFVNLTGFRETSYDDTRSQLAIGVMSWSPGQRQALWRQHAQLPALAELRSRIKVPTGQRNTVRCVTGRLGQCLDPELAGALFQVASQFNLLEMAGPSVTPEDGVTRYAGDHTQGPACAIAAGAATIYRNYFAPVGGESGQA